MIFLWFCFDFDVVLMIFETGISETTLSMSFSATNTTLMDFRTIAPMYFFTGNPFLIELDVFEHSIDR